MNRIANRKNLLMIAMAPFEYALATGRFTNSCCICNTHTETLCYIAKCDNVFCPECMRNFVKSAAKFNICTEAEVNNYNSIANKFGLNSADSYGIVKSRKKVVAQ